MPSGEVQKHPLAAGEAERLRLLFRPEADREGREGVPSAESIREEAESMAGGTMVVVRDCDEEADDEGKCDCFRFMVSQFEHALTKGHQLRAAAEEMAIELKRRDGPPEGATAAVLDWKGWVYDGDPVRESDKPVWIIDRLLVPASPETDKETP